MTLDEYALVLIRQIEKHIPAGWHYGDPVATRPKVYDVCRECGRAKR